MSEVIFYRGSSWPHFIELQQHWMRGGPHVVVVPGKEEKARAEGLFEVDKVGWTCTIDDLVQAYAAASLGSGRLLSAREVEALAGDIVREGRAPFLPAGRQKQGYIRALADYITTCRRNIMPPLSAGLVRPDAVKPGFRAEELNGVLQEYERRLAAAGHDYRSALELFCADAGSGSLCRLLGFEEDKPFLFFGFTFLTPLEAVFLQAFLGRASRAVFLHCAARTCAEPARRVEQSLRPLLEGVEAAVFEDLPGGKTENGALDSLAGALFAESRPGMSPFCSALELHLANNRHEEVNHVARRVRCLVEEGVAPDRIAVLAPSYDLYAHIIEEVFPDHGVAFRLERGLPLLHYPLGRLVYQLVSQGLLPNPYPYREAIFNAPYISFGRKVAAADLIDYQRNAAGSNLLPEEKLTELCEPLKGCPVWLDYPFLVNLQGEAYRRVKPPQGLPLPEVLQRFLTMKYGDNQQALQAELFQCLLQLYLLQQAEKALSLGSARLDGPSFREAVLDLLRRFAVEDNISLAGTIEPGYYRPGGPAREAEAKDRLVLWAILCLLDQMTITRGGKRPTAELARAFARQMEEARLEPPPLPAGEEQALVSVEPVEQVHCRKRDHLFLLGLVDGEFPAREAFNFLQQKRDGLAPGRSYTAVDHARNRFYHLLRSAGDTLHASVPLSHNGKALSPSPFFREIEKHAAGEGLNRNGGDEKRSLPPLTGNRETLTHLAANVDEDYASVEPLLREIRVRDHRYWKKLCDIMRFDGLTLDTAALSEYDGIFSSGVAAREAGEGGPVCSTLMAALEAITYDAEHLERYASCPLRFLLGDLVGLVKGPDYDPDTEERGALVRSLLLQYTLWAASGGEWPDNGGQKLLSWAEAFLAQQGKEAGDAFESRFQWRLLSGLDESETARPGLFAAFVRAEREQEGFLRPWAGGVKERVLIEGCPPLEVFLERVDLSPATGGLVLYRYSVAGTGSVSKMLRGLHYALPLGLLALEEGGARTWPGRKILGAGTYLVKSPGSLRRGGYLGREEYRSKRRSGLSADVPILSGQHAGFFSDEGLEEFLEQLRGRIAGIFALMRRGVFHPPLCSEADQTCANCTLGRVCRKDQLRLDRLWFNNKNDPHLQLIEAAGTGPGGGER